MNDALQSDRELLRVAGLHAFYGESHILHGIDFNVNRGEVVTLLGRNGAGRTTTLRAILGLTGRRSGSIEVDGRETIAMRTHRIAHLGIGYCPEERGIFASLSAEENLLLPPAVASGGMTVDEIYAMFPNLHERRASPGMRLSGGEQQMRAIASICCSPPDSRMPGLARRSCKLGNIAYISSTVIPPLATAGGSSRFSSAERLAKMPRSSGQ